jgi:hypothetical protein
MLISIIKQGIISKRVNNATYKSCIKGDNNIIIPYMHLMQRITDDSSALCQKKWDSSAVFQLEVKREIDFFNREEQT